MNTDYLHFTHWLMEEESEGTKVPPAIKLVLIDLNRIMSECDMPLLIQDS